MIIILGAAASLLVEWLKAKFQTKEYMTLFVLLLVSIALSALYTYFVDIGIWQVIANVLVLAGAFYTFVLARFK